MKTWRLTGAWGAGVAMAAVLLAGLLAGCEEGEGTSALTVSPREATLAKDQSTLALSVGSTAPVSTNSASSASASSSGLRKLSLPLTWSVSDPSLGGIVESSGAVAIYRRTPRGGVQVITVRDQYGAEGIAAVTQKTK